MSQTERYLNYINNKLTPMLAENALDLKNGGCYEILNSDLSPIKLSYKRLITHSRLIYSFSFNKNNLPIAINLYDFMYEKFFDHNKKSWHYSIGELRDLPQNCFHLYSLAFSILASASLYKQTKDNQYLQNAIDTLNFINNNFIDQYSGFITALDNNLNKLNILNEHNSAMHLLEACLYLYEESDQIIIKETINKITNCFINKFYHNNRCIIEFYSKNWNINTNISNKIELKSEDWTNHQGTKLIAGHHFQWSYLLAKCLKISDSDNKLIKEKCKNILDFAFKYGIDQELNGVYENISLEGKVIKSSKRIWGQVTALIASQNSDFFNYNSNFDNDKFIKFLFTYFLDENTGTWNESLNSDLSILRTDLPLSTPYHLIITAEDLV